MLFAASTGEGVISPASSLRSLSATVANLFPVWLVLAALLALWKPSLFLWFQKDYVTAGLALTMLSMGTSLTIDVSLYPALVEAMPDALL